MRDCRSRVRGGWLVRVSAIVAAVGLVVVGTPWRAAAAAAPVTDWAELQAAFAAGGTITLGADIARSDGQSLQVGTGRSVTLDLNGHSVTISNVADGEAGVGVPDGTSLTVAGTGGGTLNAQGGQGGAGIGGGDHTMAGTLILSGGTLTAQGGLNASGVGGGDGAPGGTVTVSGGTLTATGGANAAGVGGGSGWAGGAVTVTGGTLTATGGSGGAGIGGGSGGNAGLLLVSGGTVSATGGFAGAGIGGGFNGYGGPVTVAGGTVTATTGGFAAAVGGSNDGPGGMVTIEAGGTLIAAGGIGGGNADAGFGTLSNAGQLTVPSGTPLTVPAGIVVPNSGTMIINSSLAGAGHVDNTGTIRGPVAGNGQGGPGALLVSTHNYTLTFDPAGGSPASPLHVYAGTVADAQLSLPTPQRTGYVFTGWFTSGGTQVDHDADLAQAAGADGPVTIALHARYTIASYPVDFDPAGGAPAPDQQQVDYGALIAVPTAPDRPGYRFLGWFTGDGTRWDFATDTVTGPLTLHAHYRPLAAVALTARPTDGAAYGSPVTLTATVTGPAGSSASPSGQVDFAASPGGGICAGVALDVRGVASCTVDDLPVGAVSFTATYAGDTLYTAATRTLAYRIRQATPTVTLSAHPVDSAPEGSPVTVTATVVGPGAASPMAAHFASRRAAAVADVSSGAGTADPTGTLTVTVDGNPIPGCTQLALTNSGATCTTSTLPVGHHTLHVAYSGDANYLGIGADLAYRITAAATRSSADPSTPPQEQPSAGTSTRQSQPTSTITSTPSTPKSRLSDTGSSVSTALALGLLSIISGLAILFATSRYRSNRPARHR